MRTFGIRAINIRTSLLLLFALCGVVMGGQALFAFIDAAAEVRETADIGQIAQLNRQLFTAIQNIRFERGPTRVALDAKEAADPKFLAEMTGARDKAAPALAGILEGCRQIKCGEGDVGGVIQRANQAVLAIRQQVDPALKQSLAERKAGLSAEWYKTSTALVEALERLSVAMTEKIRMVNPAISELVTIKELAWSVRDAIGLERTIIQDMMAAKAVSPEAKANTAKLKGQAESSWRILRMLAARPGVPDTVVNAIKRTQAEVFEGYMKKGEAVQKALTDRTPLPVSELELLTSSNTALDIVVDICTAALTEVITFAERHAAAARLRLLVSGCLLVLALVAAAFGSYFVWRRVARPIGVISGVMLAMADGNLETDMPFTQRRDEIGDLARAGHAFQESLSLMRTREAEQKDAELRAMAEKRAAEELEVRRQKEMDARLAAERKDSVNALAQQFEAAVGHIMEAVSTAANELQTTAGNLTRTADKTQHLSGSVAAASEQASGSVQSVASATEEMASSVKEISRQVHETNKIASDAVRQAQATDSRIAQLSQAAGRIGDVVKLITAIAEQTNLLALNATIEAARAGEAGKGFAVVAQEVKALASQTAKATGDIGAQIAEMQTATRESVDAIKEIGITIGRISEIATSVAAAIEEQGTATGEISGNVHEVAQATAQVASTIQDVNAGAMETGASSRQVLGAAQSLATESSKLKQELRNFLATVTAA